MSNQYTPVRHHYDDMPPYNYPGIDDQIDGSYYTGSDWNLLFAGGANQPQTQDVNTTTTTTTTTDSVRTTAEEVSRVACGVWHVLTYMYVCIVNPVYLVADILQQTDDYCWRGSQIKDASRGQQLTPGQTSTLALRVQDNGCAEPAWRCAQSTWC